MIQTHYVLLAKSFVLLIQGIVIYVIDVLKDLIIIVNGLIIVSEWSNTSYLLKTFIGTTLTFTYMFLTLQFI